MMRGKEGVWGTNECQLHERAHHNGPSSPGSTVNSSDHPKEITNVVNVHWCEMNMVRSFIVSGSCGTRSPRCSIVWWSGRRPSISMKRHDRHDEERVVRLRRHEAG